MKIQHALLHLAGGNKKYLPKRKFKNASPIFFRALMMLCICLHAISVYAQEPPFPDSLLNLANAEKDKFKKAELFKSIAEKTANTDPDTSGFYARAALALAQEIDNARFMMEAEHWLAVHFLRTGKPDSTIYITTKNLAQLGDEKSILRANYLNLEGNYLMRANRQKEALERFYKGLEVAEAIQDPVSRAKAHNNIGYALMELNQFEKAIEQFKLSMMMMRRHDLRIYATVYNNIASCFGALSQLDSAKKYVTQGIRVAEANHDFTAQANGLNILATVYYTRQQYNEALETLLKARTIREKIGVPFFIVSDMATIADLYSKTGDYKKGIQISHEALELASKHNLTAKLPIIYGALANNYENSGDLKSAVEVYKKMNALKDSLYAEASPEALAEMQTRYETAKKENKIKEQEYTLQRIRTKNILLYGIIALAVLAGLLVYTQYRRYRWKQEARLRTMILKQQELATKAVLEAEEAERQRIAKDLHDGVGQMMSAAKMNLSAYENRAKFTDPEDRQAFDKIIALVDESCREVRAVSHNMMPNALLKNSLASAVREFIDKLDHKTLQVHVYTEGLDERLDSNVETVLYRVIQECVNNVIKHANADVLDISLIKEAHEITATIEDNGKGFDISDRNKSDGIGFKNIRSRIEYLKGTLDIDSTPGKGTLVAIHVPL